MARNGKAKNSPRASTIRCAIYTRKSTEEGLEQEFNSLDAQRESAEAYIASQKAEGWVCLPDRYDDGGFTGGNMDRPAVGRLMADIEAGIVDCVVVYKVDRLSRSLMDFARMMATFDKHHISFVSVTQQFNTTHSMGRLTLNILLSFAQFEREIISERTRDKIAAARRKGKWSGGRPILGYDVAAGSKLVINEPEAKRVRGIFDLYLEKQSLIQTAAELNKCKWKTKQWTTHAGVSCGGNEFDKCNLLRVLANVAYLGKVRYKDEVHPGEHKAIVDEPIWTRVQAMLERNGPAVSSYVQNKYGALLKRLLYCKPCQLAMSHAYTVKQGNRAYRYYVCATAQKQGWKTCPSKSLPAEEIERFVVERIRSMETDPATLDQARASLAETLAQLDSERQSLDRELKRLHTEIRMAAPSVSRDNHTSAHLADLQERLRAAEQRRTVVAAEVDASQAQLISRAEAESAMRGFDALWKNLSPKEQARGLRLLIRRIDYDGNQGTLSIAFHPSGLRTLTQTQLKAESEDTA